MSDTEQSSQPIIPTQIQIKVHPEIITESWVITAEHHDPIGHTETQIKEDPTSRGDHTISKVTERTHHIKAIAHQVLTIPDLTPTKAVTQEVLVHFEIDTLTEVNHQEMLAAGCLQNIMAVIQRRVVATERRGKINQRCNVSVAANTDIGDPIVRKTRREIIHPKPPVQVLTEAEDVVEVEPRKPRVIADSQRE